MRVRSFKVRCSRLKRAECSVGNLRSVLYCTRGSSARAMQTVCCRDGQSGFDHQINLKYMAYLRALRIFFPETW